MHLDRQKNYGLSCADVCNESSTKTGQTMARAMDGKAD